VELTHTDFTKVTRVVLIEEGAMVVLTTCITATTRMFAVFANTTMAHLYMATLLASFVKTGRHCNTISWTDPNVQL
jgi:hypothetical protein